MSKAVVTAVLAWLAAAAPSLAQPASPPQHAQPPVVLELFTSQGCSSCPAADALLAKYTERQDLMALSLSVDYWDHLGWKDTLASPKHSARQKAYAKALGTGNVYTPQVVVNGAWQAVGSNKAEIDKAIGQARKAAGRAPVALKATIEGKRVIIDLTEAAPGQAQSATIWLAVVAPRVEVKVKKGENTGKMLPYHNVVREIMPVGMWAGKPMHVELPANVLLEAGDRCAVLLQSEDGGRILGAVWASP